MSLEERARRAWAAIAPRFAAFHFVGPETPGFRCLMSACPANCCRSFTVPLDAADLERFVRVSGLRVEEVVECDEQGPVVLPLSEPYVLARANGACKFLSPDGCCTQYAARPTACRLYPYQVVLVEEPGGRLLSPSPERLRAALEAFSKDEPTSIVPVLLRHADCPGFLDAPLGVEKWRRLFRDVLEVQYQHLLASLPS